MKEALFRAVTIIAIIGVIGAVGGLEHDMLSYEVAFLEIGISLLAAIFCNEQAEAHYRAKRRKRKMRSNKKIKRMVHK
ncbi:MAG: hypothetical protein IKU47_08010 [Oscillospiraceae bacterium]|nr:hypothetical protein [Oscillospiraceae bacterium]